MMMPGREYQAQPSRFGFNGKENDNDVKGFGNQQDYGSRIYDPRIARWLSLDPLQKKYPGESNYNFVSNSPLLFKDEDGKDKIVTVTLIGKDGTMLKLTMTDYSYSEYKKASRYGKLPQTYKNDVEIDVVIDFSKTGNDIVSKVTFNSDRFNFNDISQYEYSVFSDYVNGIKGWLGFDTENKKTKFGYKVIGNGINTKWIDGLPKAGEGSETLNLKSFLDLAGGLKGENAEYEEKVLKMFAVVLLGEKVEKVGKVEKAAHVLDNTSKVAEALEHLITEVREQQSVNTQNQSNTGLEPNKAKHVNDTVLIPNKYGRQGLSGAWYKNKDTTVYYIEVPANNKKNK